MALSYRPGKHQTMSDRLKLLAAVGMVVAGLLLCAVSATWIDLPARANVSDDALTEDAPGFDPADFPVITGTVEGDIDPAQLATVAPKPTAIVTPARTPTAGRAAPVASTALPTATRLPSA